MVLFQWLLQYPFQLDLENKSIFLCTSKINLESKNNYFNINVCVNHETRCGFLEGSSHPPPICSESATQSERLLHPSWESILWEPSLRFLPRTSHVAGIGLVTVLPPSLELPLQHTGLEKQPSVPERARALVYLCPDQPPRNYPLHRLVCS